MSDLVRRLRSLRKMTIRRECVDTQMKTIRVTFEAFKAIQELCGEAADKIEEMERSKA